MPQGLSTHTRSTPAGPDSGPQTGRSRPRIERVPDPRLTRSMISAAVEANHGIGKLEASRLFSRVAVSASVPAGRVRAELIPDSSWKRAGKTLGPQASQTVSRLGHVLGLAERVWGNEADATEWLNSPHSELRGATPYSMLKTEAGGRAIEALLAAIEFEFPV
jgi:putative toxin-antitoxin system antitoxin component (TIGR02293 family)